MQKNLKNAFLKAIYVPEGGLINNVWLAVVRHDRRVARFKLTILSIIGGVSLFSLIPAFKALTLDFSQSGFYDYFSLLFSNGDSIVNFWKEFLLILAESLPVLSIALFLLLIFIFFLSLKYILKQIIKGQLSF